MSAWFNIGEYLAKSTILGRLLDSGYRYVIHPKETAAGYTAAQLTFGFDPGDLRRYGADPTGVAASDAAMTKALAIMGPTGFNGGTIKLPAGTYLFNNAWNLNQLSGVTIEGAGNATAGAGAGTLCKYGGTGATHWIQLTSAIGCRIRCMALQPTLTTFTGAIVRCGNDGTHGDSALCSVEEVTFDATVDCYHLDLDKCIEFSARSCAFLSGATSVKGQASAGGSYSNVVEFQRCEWVQCQTAPINYLGQSWAFRNCTFEDLASGAPGAIAGASAVAPAVGLCVQDCWFGDATATVGTWIAGCLNAALIAGNYFAGNVGGTTAIALSQAAGVAIMGNTFTACLNAIDFAAGNCYGISCRGNYNDGSTNFYVGSAANVPLGQLDFALGFGIGIPPGHGQLGNPGYRVEADGSIVQWGLFSPASHGNNNVVFPIPFPTSCDKVDCTLSAVTATTATIYPGVPTVNGFSANIQDGTSTTDSFYWEARGR